ncbi:hypothetical protein BFP97_03785 [Roseivirga sp. 4D4]|uniref:carboxypeptidase-like regulatory domain-containing protein n=1 Tax=Roseivirga sp. 4D4 TaxID=1889784 RepID=UPI000853C1AD|nr:carboxypeptidase-like regulatory domain-containing protein [Roseivirga sp. 4D4]OEK00680.1 hypothetical protein BFP97_03785 [Roseivirga sp. 4D4]
MARFTLCILCLTFFEVIISGQTLKSQVIDRKTGQPIPYVNIGIVGKNIGTVSDNNGRFQLSIENAVDSDTLRLSMISYVTQEFIVGDLRRLEVFELIEMDQRQIELKEVTVLSQRPSQIKLGLEKRHCYPIPLYKGASSNIAFPQNGYRHEIGTRFSNDRPLYLDSIQLNFAVSFVDTIEFRLNIYSIQNQEISNILSEPIYISLSKSEAENSPVIYLSKYEIEVHSDFLVTIENYQQMPVAAVKILANFKSKGRVYPTYYRSNSQGNWVKLQTKKSKDIGISFIVFGQ